MENDQLVSIEQFCVHYNIEYSFIQTLTEYGLVEITTINETKYLYKEQIRDVEKMIRLHFDLDINMEGIEAISHLLQRMDQLQGQILSLRNKLNLYEHE